MTWKRLRRGYYETSDGRLYISRTRRGWEYGEVERGPRFTEHFKIGETTRPLARAKQLAERREAAV